MEYLIRKANGTTVRVSRDEYERILSRVAEGERADKLAESAREIKDLVDNARCQCGDRHAAQCGDPWGPDCDLGNNESHVRRHGGSLRLPVAELGERRWGAQ